MKLVNLLASSHYNIYNKDIARKYGVITSIILSQLCSMSDNLAKNDGWFFCSAETMENETTISAYKQAKSYKKLENAGIIETKLKGLPAVKHFRIKDLSILFDDLQTTTKTTSKQDVKKLENLYKETSKQDVKKLDTINITNQYNNQYNNSSSDENSITKSKVLELFNSSYPKSINRATLEPTLMQFDGNLNELVNGLQRYSKYCKATKPKLQHITDATNFIKYKKYLNGFEYTKDPEEEYINAMPKLKVVRADR